MVYNFLVYDCSLDFCPMTQSRTVATRELELPQPHPDYMYSKNQEDISPHWPQRDYRQVPLIRPPTPCRFPAGFSAGGGRELDQGCQVQHDVQQRRSSDSMSWIVHTFILDWQVLCTAVHASVQHRIFVVYAEFASQVENRPDQRYFTV